MPQTDITVDFSHQDGNAFAILGAVTQALRRGGRPDLVEPFRKAATSGDYGNLLATVGEYVVVDFGDPEEENCAACGEGEEADPTTGYCEPCSEDLALYA